MTKTVGQRLKQARLERGLTIEQAAQATRIRVVYLQALESDQREALPSAVQSKGFLRLYAGHLSLPLQPLLDQWDGKPLPPEPVPPQPAPQESGEGLAGSGEIEEEPQPMAFVPSTLDGSALPPSNPAPESDSQAIFREIGQKLRQQRETLGLSVIEVERFTHLRQHFIQALEEGNPAGLPSPVQGRGMLSNYAAFLNIKEDDLLLRYAEALQARRVERVRVKEPAPLFSNKKRPARQAPFWRRFITPDLMFGIGLAAAILFFVLWTASRITALQTDRDEPTPPAISEVLLNAQVEQSTVTGEPFVTAGESQSGAPAPENQPNPPYTPLPTLAPTQTAAPPALAPMNNDPLQVYIVARQRAWLQVTSDGKVDFLGRVVPGNAYAFSASKQIELITGNAAALQVFFNQSDLGVLGTAGEVSGLVFSKEGIMTPTPAFTPTATATRPVTATPQPTGTPPATPTVTPLIP